MAYTPRMGAPRSLDSLARSTYRNLLAIQSTTDEGLAGDLTPQLGGDLDLNGNGFVATLVAGEPLVADQLVRMDGTSRMVLADASTESSSSGMLAICTQNVAANDPGIFLLRGFYDIIGMTPGRVLYVSTTPGGIDITAPLGDGIINRILGYAVTSSQIFFDPDKTWTELKLV